jgi:hypothetical protein
MNSLVPPMETYRNAGDDQWWWRNFIFRVRGDNAKYVWCSNCRKYFSPSNQISRAIKQHLFNHHPNDPVVRENAQSDGPIDQFIKVSGTTRQDKIQLLAVALAINHIPFHVVECPLYQQTLPVVVSRPLLDDCLVTIADNGMYGYVCV